MAKLLSLSSLLLLFALSVIPASAAPILAANFCPGNASCPAGLEEASLVFNEDFSTVLDLNDYTLDVTFDGGATGPLFLDIWSFTINGVQTPDGYEIKPSILSFSDGAGWVTHFDNVGANAAACTTDPGSSQEVCANPTSPASLLNNTVTFQLSVDLFGDGLGEDDFLIASNTTVNLRALFVDANGNKVGAILSPNSNTVDFPRDITEVPEPATLFLLGSGLTFALRRRRKS